MYGMFYFLWLLVSFDEQTEKSIKNPFGKINCDGQSFWSCRRTLAAYWNIIDSQALLTSLIPDFQKFELEKQNEKEEQEQIEKAKEKKE